MSRPRAQSPITVERLDFDRIDWTELDAYPDREVFQTREWMEFVARAQDAEPMLAELRSEGERVGYFSGLVFRRFGVRILGSPFPGWTTACMGFNLREGTVSRRDALAAIVPFAFKELGCLHMEVKDLRLTADDLDSVGFRHSPFLTFEVVLKDDESLLAGMSRMGRRLVRRSGRTGVTVEEASGVEFADEYHAQLVDVFAKQGLDPIYGVERVRDLVRCMEPSGRLLLLRARNPDGMSIGTGIFPALNGRAWFWGGASWRPYQNLNPNEAIFWYAMRYWRERGMRVLDMGGGGDYKRKFGVQEVVVPMARRARLPILLSLRDLAERAYERRLGLGR